MEHAIPVKINEEFTVYIASLAGQFLIKLDSWMDRHDRDHKDAEDMYYILANGLAVICETYLAQNT